MNGLVAKLEPLHAPEIPPLGDDGKPSLVVGHTPLGKTIYRRHLIRSEKKPVIDPETGKQRWALHPTTAQPLYRLWTRERLEFDQEFTMESDGKGQIYTIPWYPPTAEELALAAEKEQEERFRKEFFRIAATSGITPQDAVDAIRNRQFANVPAEGEVSPRAELEKALAEQIQQELGAFPKSIGPARWELSSGEVIKGTKQVAVDAEQAVLMQKAAAASADGLPAI